ncbi:hypothetical protein PBI_LUCKY3_10 [Microbacterium phage Lucky3]|uniref:Uncharacterized protein n=2 Tax=Kojivirus golden TaxID=2560590 RepID=A0A2P1CFQ3_9CAUD|nr:hypothetical protein FDJ42_gp10 [Microbacterium phage Golden]AVJ49758.1 hypothetical protein PBI_GOLDEN_10 [Microbacterium phage Golden]AVJ50067.1 hypothetical protein PBI_LUCKY3_10 [Microbacterium phage Lucky3]
MVMSTQTLAEAAKLLTTPFVDSVQLLLVGEPVTVGFEVVRETVPVGDPVAALVQTTTLANAVESQVVNVYSVKVPQGTVIDAGMAVEVLTCQQEPSLVGKKLLLDKVSQNGLALIRKAVASDFHNVDQQGKENLS